MMSQHSKLLHETITNIQPVSRDIHARTQLALDRLTKPVGSLGRLEELAAQYVAISQELPPLMPEPVVFTLAADHGVVREGVSAYPSSVTAQMVMNFLKGGAAINVLAQQVGAQVRVVDMGVETDLGNHSGLLVHKIGYGTDNFANGPAMSQEQALQSIEVGIRLARDAYADGLRILGIGDMGIGNTTTSSAIAAVMTEQSVDKVTGKGTGVDAERFARKVQIIEQGIKRNQPNSQNPVDVLAKVGGFEIGGLVGLILGGAACRIPVVLDGFITGAAMLLAQALAAHCQDYVIPSHCSAEPGHRFILEHLDLYPLLDLNLRLGEGTGACLAIGLLQASIACLRDMATFDSAGVDGAEASVPETA
jgi:nicotinate-nucleotide--dimethylbenzimidazole phosphoribosyltransferase